MSYELSALAEKPLFFGPPGFPRPRCDRCENRLGSAFHFARIDVEAGHAKVLFAVSQGERKTAITQADNADARFTLLNFVVKEIERRLCGREYRHENLGNEQRYSTESSNCSTLK